MTAEEAVRAAFVSQTGWCTRLGSPFTARLCAALARRLDRSTPIGRQVLDWPGDPSPEADNVPARLCGALHFLARSGEAPGLARLYPPAPLPDADALWGEIAPLLSAKAAAIGSFLDDAPQTNEIGRSAVLMAGLRVVAESFGLPMRLFELGSSAGLNLLLDRYAFDLGGREAGDPASLVRIAPLWTGPAPPAAEVRIVERRGVDISPRDPRADGERLLAFVWPDQAERIARLQAALALAAAGPPPVDRADAADWLERVLPASPREGAVRVVLHSIAFQYFPAATQRRIETLIDRLGREASAEAPMAWLRYEYLPGEEQASLRLRSWPGAERHLAWAHGHGTNVEWLAIASARERR